MPAYQKFLSHNEENEGYTGYRCYERVEYNNIPVWVNPEKPDWFIPTKRADMVLRHLKKNMSVTDTAFAYHRHYNENFNYSLQLIHNLLSRIECPTVSAYKGRSVYRTPLHLRECWFHITNRCNMSCRHCMFSSNMHSGESLDYRLVLKTIEEASALGCRVFYFTGGEPLVYPEFTTIIDTILQDADTHVVVLSNGRTLTKFDRWFRTVPHDRFHLQLSIDGLEVNHDLLRGEGAFRALLDSLNYAASKTFPVNLAMSVNSYNVHEMDRIVDIAHQYNIKNVHYLWLFKKGRSNAAMFVDPEIIFAELVKSYEKAEGLGISIDNAEILKSQVFSLSGTRFDLSNAGWESLAVGPDGIVYPSPALVGERALAAGSVREGLEKIWKSSRILGRLRKASVIDIPTYDNVLKYIIGGGDIDHSYIAGRTFVGHDPYMELYYRMTLYLLSREATGYDSVDTLGLLSRMGEKLYECDENSASVGFTHSNCVLSLPGKDGYFSVKSFYSKAAATVNEDIINPVNYPESDIAHIPLRSRIRSYGCGSPVLDCDVRGGETIVDLGSGAGLECFIAAKKVGPSGKVIGIDMETEMIRIATDSSTSVRANLGYDNIAFRRGFLEKIPVDTVSVDAVISNCVINLSPDKRRTFREIFRILKPGGRICISDIVCTEDIPLEMKYNETLRGECIGGAMRQAELVAMLEDIDFKEIFIVKRFLYRQINGYDFYSITYMARKPQRAAQWDIIYRGPFAAVMTDSGQILKRGRVTSIALPPDFKIDNSFFVLDSTGNVTNVEQDITCAVFVPPEKPTTTTTIEVVAKHATGCFICGSDIVYLNEGRRVECFYCRKVFHTHTLCAQGHYVCDRCHSRDALQVIREICLQSHYRDVIGLFKKIRSHPAVPMHGPEYHSLVPAVILSVYRNLGGKISESDILTAIERGTTVAGGACAFLGICGAASGVGIAFSVILKSNPYTARERQIVQQATHHVLEKIAAYKAPRCCQRDCWIGLTAAAELSERYFPVVIRADEPLVCGQSELNKECIRHRCPLWEQRKT